MVMVIIIIIIVCKGILDKQSYTYEDVQDKDNGPIVTGQSTLTYMSSKNVTSTQHSVDMQACKSAKEHLINVAQRSSASGQERYINVAQRRYASVQQR